MVALAMPDPSVVREVSPPHPIPGVAPDCLRDNDTSVGRGRFEGLFQVRLCCGRQSDPPHRFHPLSCKILREGIEKRGKVIRCMYTGKNPEKRPP